MCNRPNHPIIARRAILRAGLATGTAAGTLAVAGVSASTASAQMVDPTAKPTQEITGRILQDWPETATMAARNMIEKYGQPHEATPSLMIWYENGPWKRTIVYKEEIDHDFPMPHKDVLEQVVNYEVPPDRFDELAAYDGSVIVERTKGEISARCDKEAANFLALNLANDIVNGRKSVEEARRDYADTIRAMMAGETPQYTQELAFQTPEEAGDSDVALIEDMPQGQQ